VYFIVGIITFPGFAIINKIKITGTEHLKNLPKRNVLFVSNHQTYFADVIMFLHIFCAVKWRKENKLGMRASETSEMIFDNCRVPDENRMGEPGEGFKQAMKVLDGGRISIAALALGIAKGAYEASLKYSKERYQFDQPISNFQAISFKLADMATEIMAGTSEVQKIVIAREELR